MPRNKEPEIRVIKKYPNRRLYDTATSTYITISDVKDIIQENEDVKVIDAKTGEDLTHQTLLQIIVETETGSANPILSNNALVEFIRMPGGNVQEMLSQYMDANIQAFLDIQKKFTENAAMAATSANPQTWTQFLTFQGPAMKALMNTYLEQNTKFAAQMNESVSAQTQKMINSLNITNYINKTNK